MCKTTWCASLQADDNIIGNTKKVINNHIDGFQ